MKKLIVRTDKLTMYIKTLGATKHTDSKESKMAALQIEDSQAKD